MKRKLLSALLAVTLLLGILSGVGMAAGAPVLAYTPAGSGKVTLALEIRAGPAVSAVQLDLQFQLHRVPMCTRCSWNCSSRGSILTRPSRPATLPRFSRNSGRRWKTA